MYILYCICIKRPKRHRETKMTWNWQNQPKTKGKFIQADLPFLVSGITDFFSRYDLYISFLRSYAYTINFPPCLFDSFSTYVSVPSSIFYHILNQCSKMVRFTFDKNGWSSSAALPILSAKFYFFCPILLRISQLVSFGCGVSVDWFLRTIHHPCM